MDLIKKANSLGYKHYTEFTIDELSKLSLNNPNKQIEYYFIQKWLREEYNIHIELRLNVTDASKDCYLIVLKEIGGNRFTLNNKSDIIKEWDSFKYNYEESLEIGLQEALKLIK